MSISVSEIVAQLQTETALTVTRDVSKDMGKTDFLQLLAAQLRYQDPLEPTKDSDFAAQLAQFSSLEQMENMNKTLSLMAGYQAYSLVGKYVIASAYVDGELSLIPGYVERVFTDKGVTYAQVGGYDVPLDAITQVFDTASLLTPNMLMQTSNNLLGRMVRAQVGEDVIEGTVVRLTVEEGQMYAFIDNGTEKTVGVPVGAIFDIRQAGAPIDELPKDKEPEEIETEEDPEAKAPEEDPPVTAPPEEDPEAKVPEEDPPVTVPPEEDPPVTVPPEE